MTIATASPFANDPQAQAILRRRALAEGLQRQAMQQDFRSPLSPVASVAQTAAGLLGAHFADRDLREHDTGQREEARQFVLSRQLMGSGGAPAPAATGNATPAVMQTPLPPVGGSPAVAPADLMPLIEEASRETGIPVPILTAQIRQESNFDPNARGRAGEIGLAQIMPATARQPGFGVPPADPARLAADPRENIMFGARYLRGRGQAAGVTDWNDPAQVDRALAAYNGGGDPNYVQNVRRWMGQGGQGATIPAQAQTQPTPQAPPAGGNMQQAALEAMQSRNPRIAAMAPMLAQMGRRDTTPPPTVTMVGPQGAGVYERLPNGQTRFLGAVPETPDRTLETVADPSSPTGFRRVTRDNAVGQPVAGPQALIDQRGPNAFDQRRGTALADEEVELRAAGPRARQTLARIGTIEQNLERVRTGALAGQQLRLGQIANAIGVPPTVLERIGMDPAAVAAGEQIDSLASQMLIGMIGPGGFPAANFSNPDREMLQRALPGLANSPEGNRLIIQVFRAQAQRQMQITDAWNQWRRQNGSSMESFDRFQQERLPEITGTDVLAPLLQDAVPAANQPGMAGGVPLPGGQMMATPPAPGTPAPRAAPRARNAQGQVVEWNGTAWVPAR